MQRRTKLDFQHSATVLAQVLDALDIAVLILNGQRKVCFTNLLAASLLSVDGQLTIERGKLTCADPETADSLDKFLKAAARPLQHAAATFIAINGNRPMCLTALPLGLSSQARSSGSQLLVLITDPKVCPKSRECAVTRLFGLTPAEVRVAMLVAAGVGAKEISRRIGATHHTVRYQLKAIFRKTGTDRQSQLARLISLIPGQLEAARSKSLPTGEVQPASPLACNLIPGGHILSHEGL